MTQLTCLGRSNDHYVDFERDFSELLDGSNPITDIVMVFRGKEEVQRLSEQQKNFFLYSSPVIWKWTLQDEMEEMQLRGRVEHGPT